MTRRVLASFLLVLIAMIAFVEIPLGVELARHEREDFQLTTQASARSLAAAAEERLGDAGEQSSATGLHLDVDPGDAVAVANRRGAVIARFGAALPAQTVRRALAGETVSVEDRTLATARVGESGATDGTVLLARSSEPLDHRLGALTAALAAAAIGALALGTIVAITLARWVGRPVNGLRRVATEIGAGRLDLRAAETGPPEVRELAADVNLMAERIGDLLDNQRAMISDVSHQLRTPLAALRLRLENLAAESDEVVRADLTASLEEINRLNRLADGLLAVARAEHETHAPQPIPVADVIGERIALWRDLAADREVELVDASTQLTALAGPGQLEQILDNLIANAIDAVPPNTAVGIRTERRADEIVILVVDHGPGLTTEERARAFERFSGLGDNRPRSAGLGLAIVGGLIKANHGTAQLTETPGGGLTVNLTLPARTDA